MAKRELTAGEREFHAKLCRKHKCGRTQFVPGGDDFDLDFYSDERTMAALADLMLAVQSADVERARWADDSQEMTAERAIAEQRYEDLEVK